jgi:hypothetical protein
MLISFFAWFACSLIAVSQQQCKYLIQFSRPLQLVGEDVGSKTYSRTELFTEEQRIGRAGSTERFSIVYLLSKQA